MYGAMTYTSPIAVLFLGSVAAWIVLTIVRPTIWRAASRAFRPASRVGTVVMCLCVFSPLVGSLLDWVWEPVRAREIWQLFFLPLLAWEWWIVIYGLRHTPLRDIDEAADKSGVREA
jgi:hypothetical protein